MDIVHQFAGQLRPPALDDLGLIPALQSHVKDFAKRLPSLSSESPDGRGAITKKAGLSSREVEVLQLIAEGKANKQVARELGISIKTVEKHRQRLMSKLDLHDTAGLTRYAIAAGIIESPVQVTII